MRRYHRYAEAVLSRIRVPSYAAHMTSLTTLTAPFVAAYPGEDQPVATPDILLPNPGGSQVGTAAVFQLEQRIAELSRAKEELEQKRQADAQLTRFAELMRWHAEQSLGDWSDQLLRECVPMLHGIQAALYLADGDTNTFDHLRLIGSYAPGPEQQELIQMGSGLTGETGRSGHRILLQDEQVNCLAASSLAVITPRVLLIEPLVYNGTVEGVLELMGLQPLSTYELHFIQQLAGMLAASLNTIRSQLRIQDLYREAQHQREMLLAQEEEMRQNVEELEATQEEMRRVQNELKSKERWMANILDSSKDLVIVVDLNQQILFMNAAAKQLRPDINGGDLTGRNFSDELIDADHRQSFETGWARTKAGAHFSHEEVYHTPAGKQYLDISYNPLRSPSGQVVGVAFFTRDITVRKLAELQNEQSLQQLAITETELRQNLEEMAATQEEMRRVQQQAMQTAARLERIADNVEGLLYQYQFVPSTGEHGFLFVSKRSAAMFGIAPEDLMGKLGTDVAVGVHPEDIQSFTDTFVASLTSMQPFHWIGRIRNVDDEYRLIQADSTPSLMPDGTIVWDGYMVDINDRMAPAAQDKPVRQNKKQLRAVANGHV